MLTVRLFASLVDTVGRRSLTMDFHDTGTVTGVFEELTLQCPEVAPLRSSLLIAVNYEYANWNTTLEDNDEVAFFPPVSGGSF